MTKIPNLGFIEPLPTGLGFAKLQYMYGIGESPGARVPHARLCSGGDQSQQRPFCC